MCITDIMKKSNISVQSVEMLSEDTKRFVRKLHTDHGTEKQEQDYLFSYYQFSSSQ